MLQRMKIQVGMEENRNALSFLMLNVALGHASVLLGQPNGSSFQQTLTQVREKLDKVRKDVVEIIQEHKNHFSLFTFVKPIYTTLKSNHSYFLDLKNIIVSIKDEALARFFEENYPVASLQLLELALKEFLDELEDLLPSLKYVAEAPDRHQLLRSLAEPGELAEMATALSGEKITKAERMANLLVLFQQLGLFHEGKKKLSTTELAKAATRVVDVSLDYAKDCVEAFRSNDPSNHSKTNIGYFIEGSRKWVQRLLFG